MKLMSFLRPTGEPSFGQATPDGVIDLGLRFPDCPDLKNYLQTYITSESSARSNADYTLEQITFLPVIPNPGKIVCVGLNYREHIEETGRKDSERPVLFLRTAASQTAHRSDIERPAISERFDYEGELAVIIGRSGRKVEARNALDHVAGYACYNDVTVRDWQKHTHQWIPGKNFDKTGAFGPWMVTPDEMNDFSQTRLVTRLNGETVQEAMLAQMVFSIQELIAYTSVFSELQVGDVIVSGTPGGVGDRRSPPLYMKPGDQVEVEVGGIGLLSNQIVVGT